MGQRSEGARRKEGMKGTTKAEKGGIEGRKEGRKEVREGDLTNILLT